MKTLKIRVLLYVHMREKLSGFKLVIDQYYIYLIKI